MATLEVDKILPGMTAAAKAEFSQKWPAIKHYAEAELRKLAQTLVQIETLRAASKIAEGEASVLVEIQKNTARAVMLAVNGMTSILVEAAINAALEAVRDVINGALGFTLL